MDRVDQVAHELVLGLNGRDELLDGLGLAGDLAGADVVGADGLAIVGAHPLTPLITGGRVVCDSTQLPGVSGTMVDLDDDLAAIADADPEAALHLVAAYFETRDGQEREDALRVLVALAGEGVNVPRLMREHPAAARGAFGDALPVPSESMVETVDRLAGRP